jgi:fucose permease
MALVALSMPDPSRSHSAFAKLPDLFKNNGNKALAQMARAAWATYRELGRNRLWVGTVAGYTAYTFALGGFAFWAPSYMMRVRGFSQEMGMLYFGGITVITGVVGTLLGSFLGDWLVTFTRKGYTLVGILAVTLGAIFATICLMCQSQATFLTALVATQLSLFLNTGPINALILGSVPQHMRASAMASSIFCIHLFGDAISPVLIGWISDRTSLTTGMALTPAVFGIAALLWATTLPKRRRLS